MVDHKAVFDSKGRAVTPLPPWLFGDPVLATDGNGVADWVSSQASPLFQKGHSGFLARLNSGDQSGDDWGAVYIPVNELVLNEFNEAMWSWHQTNAEAYGMNMVIWMHDPTDFDKRAEVTQAPSGATLEKGAGWNAHELNTDTTQFFYYGENTNSDLTAGTQYKWTEFQSDPRFSSWVIYRISFEWGWYSTGTFEDAYLADVSLNGEIIVIQPSNRELLLNSAPIPFKSTTSQEIEGGSAYTAKDIVSDDACTTTATANYWEFTGMAASNGGAGVIDFASLFNETENQTVRYMLRLFDAAPTGLLADNSANNNPLKGDMTKWVGEIEWKSTIADGATVASQTQGGPSTVGNLPIEYKCAAGSTSLFGVLITLTAYTQSTTDDIEITLRGFHL